MRTGRLDRRVDLEENVPVEGELNEQEENWILYRKVWARKLPRSAASRVIGSELVSEVAVVWSIRYDANVTSLMRLVDGSTIYRIDGVHEGEKRQRETLLITSTEEPARG